MNGRHYTLENGFTPNPFVYTHPAKIKIKIEVDSMPPLGFETEEKLLLKPFSFYVKCYKLSDLFAGKMHALLFRNVKNNVNGCDWYDLEWYIKNGIKLNLSHFLLHAIESGDWEKEPITDKEFRFTLGAKIDIVDMNKVKADCTFYSSSNGC